MQQAVGQALRSSGVAFSVEDSISLDGQLQMNVATQPVMTTSDENDVKSWSPSSTPPLTRTLATSIQPSGHALAKAGQRKETTYGNLSIDPAIFTLKTLAFSTCVDVGVDMLSARTWPTTGS